MSNNNHPVSPLRVRARCLEYAARPYPTEFDNRKLGAIIGHLEAAVKQLSQAGDDVTHVNRKLVQAFLFLAEDKPFESLSSKILSPQQKHALEMWVASIYQKCIYGKEIKWKTHIKLNFRLLMPGLLLKISVQNVMVI